MKNERLRSVIDYIIKHSKIVFPIILVAAVAVTVAAALGAAGNDGAGETRMQTVVGESVSKEPALTRPEDVVLEQNSDPELYTLIATYYNAMGTGDSEAIRTISNYTEETELYTIEEMSKYIESYPFIEIYTKLGPRENSWIAYVYYKLTFYNYEEEVPGLQTFYVCTNEEGELYLNTDEASYSQEEYDYIAEVSLQDDYVELYNRVQVECSEVYSANTKILSYISTVQQEVQKAVGLRIAAEQEAAAAESQTPQETTPEGEGGTEENTGENAGESTEQTPQEAGPAMATATTTVNVRSSDSEKADKLGKVAGGDKVKVLEQKVNGWSKIEFEGAEGYIKSEYLQMEESGESAEGVETVGNVTATTNINVRAAASEDAEKLGVLAGGDSAELISTENGWCKIKYDGQIAYVKEEYVEK